MHRKQAPSRQKVPWLLSKQAQMVRDHRAGKTTSAIPITAQAEPVVRTRPAVHARRTTIATQTTAPANNVRSRPQAVLAPRTTTATQTTAPVKSVRNRPLAAHAARTTTVIQTIAPIRNAEAEVPGVNAGRIITVTRWSVPEASAPKLHLQRSIYLSRGAPGLDRGDSLPEVRPMKTIVNREVDYEVVL